MSQGRYKWRFSLLCSHLERCIFTFVLCVLRNQKVKLSTLAMFSSLGNSGGDLSLFSLVFIELLE